MRFNADSIFYSDDNTDKCCCEPLYLSQPRNEKVINISIQCRPILDSIFPKWYMNRVNAIVAVDGQMLLILNPLIPIANPNSINIFRYLGSGSNGE